jgi:hypothetical protein
VGAEAPEIVSQYCKKAIHQTAPLISDKRILHDPKKHATKAPHEEIPPEKAGNHNRRLKAVMIIAFPS